MSTGARRGRVRQERSNDAISFRKTVFILERNISERHHSPAEPTHDAARAQTTIDSRPGSRAALNSPPFVVTP